MASVPKKIQLRPLTLMDIPRVMKLKSFAGWNQLISDCEFLIRAGEGGNFAAVDDGQVIGTVTTLTYKDKFSWIGMVLVDPAFRGRGIGTALLNGAIHFAQKKGTVRLDATPQGEKLYKTMGFKTERAVMRLKLSRPLVKFNRECSTISDPDLEELTEFDAPVFGAERASVLRYLFDNSPNYARYVKTNGRISGYCLGRSGSSFDQIGPIVADSGEDARKLLLAALDSCQDKPVIVDVFPENREWLETLTSLGFEIQRRFIRMYLGKLSDPGNPGSQYAIAGPEMG